MGEIALVATDMDGTLLDGEGQVPPDFAAWVQAHPDVRVVIASGRQVYTLIEQFSDIADRLIFMADNGAIVMAGGELIYENAIEPAAVRRCMELVRRIPGAVPVVCGTRSAYIGADTCAATCADIEQYYARREYLPEPLDALERDHVVKIAVYFEIGTSLEQVEHLAEVPTGLKAVASGVHWVDVAHETVNKGAALQDLQKRLDVSPAQCLAFGDYLNDRELLQACGESYAMANGHPDVKAVAKYIAPANTDDGVMRVLRERLG